MPDAVEQAADRAAADPSRNANGPEHSPGAVVRLDAGARRVRSRGVAGVWGQCPGAATPRAYARRYAARVALS